MFVVSRLPYLPHSGSINKDDDAILRSHCTTGRNDLLQKVPQRLPRRPHALENVFTIVVQYHASEVYDGLGYSRRRNESQSIIISEATHCSAAGTPCAAPDKTACEFSVET